VTDRESQFLQLVHDYDARLHRLCRVYADDEDARADLYQDILVQLWRSLPSFTGASSQGTWLYRIALNTALDSVRRSGVRRRGAPYLEEALHPQRVARPDEHVERTQIMERLQHAIARLGPVDRALVLLLLEERSYQEMSEILGISVSAVGVRLHRAKKKLGQWLEEAA
jgi:RNA polymerase sigma-70 factor (ECF subfamily)